MKRLDFKPEERRFQTEEERTAHIEKVGNIYNGLNSRYGLHSDKVVHISSLSYGVHNGEPYILIGIRSWTEWTQNPESRLPDEYEGMPIFYEFFDPPPVVRGRGLLEQLERANPE